MNRPLVARCETCESGLEHCHGTLIVHDDGDVECTVECSLAEESHDLVAVCAELERACSCAAATRR